MSEQQVLPPLPNTTDPFETLQNTARWCMAASRQDWEDDLIDIKTAASGAPKTILALFAQLASSQASLAQSEAERERLIAEAKITEQLEVEIYMALDAAGCPHSEKVEGERHSRWLNSRKQIEWLGAERERLQGELAIAREFLEEVKQCCLFADDDGEIGITTEAHISEDLFARLCACLGK